MTTCTEVSCLPWRFKETCKINNSDILWWPFNRQCFLQQMTGTSVYYFCQKTLHSMAYCITCVVHHCQSKSKLNHQGTLFSPQLVWFWCLCWNHFPAREMAGAVLSSSHHCSIWRFLQGKVMLLQLIWEIKNAFSSLGRKRCFGQPLFFYMEQAASRSRMLCSKAWALTPWAEAPTRLNLLTFFHRQPQDQAGVTARLLLHLSTMELQEQQVLLMKWWLEDIQQFSHLAPQTRQSDSQSSAATEEQRFPVPEYFKSIWKVALDFSNMSQNTRILRRGMEAKPGFPTNPFCPFLNNLYLLLHPVCAQHLTDMQKSFHCGVSTELWSDLLDRQYQKPDVASPLNYLADAASTNRSGHCLHKPTLK